MTNSFIKIIVLAALAVAAELTLQADATPNAESPAQSPDGRRLFLKNCAHCHGADARGDEGPDLHGLDWSSEQIARQIRNGRKGKMTAFAGKLQPKEIEALAAYVQKLK